MGTNVFAGITTANPFDAIEGAVKAIEKRRQVRGLLGKPWSVAELAFEPDDYRWLGEWASKLPVQTARIWLQYRGRYERIGLLLTVYASEIARREAAEKSLWANVSQAGWQPETRRVLFYNDYPRQEHRDALEAAATSYGLRNVFDRDDVDKWMASVFLQFGFTRRGAKRRLAEWLVGLGQPDAVKRLLADEHRSDSFFDLWESLRLYRRDDIEEVELRRELRQNPWVLPEWSDWLVLEARSRITSLGTGVTGVRGIDDPADSAKPIPTTCGEFLGTPRLRWTLPDNPQFICELEDLAALGLTGDAYSIAVGGKQAARVVRQGDGAYRSLSTTEIEIKTDKPEVISTLVDVANGSTVASQHIQLWEPGDDVSAFAFPSGKRINAWTDVLSPAVRYVLMLAPDLEICPSPAERRRFPNVQFCLLPANWDVETKVILENETLWRPNLTGRATSPQPNWLNGVTVDDLDEVEIETSCELCIRHPVDVSVRFARSSLGTLALRTRGERRTLAGPFSTSLAPLNGTLAVVLGVRRQNGELYRVRRQVKWELVGEARLGEDGWEPFPKKTPLSKEDALSQRFHIRPPCRVHGERINLNEWRVMEGTTPLGTLPSRPAPFGRLSGWGAPLTLRRGPYNRPAGEDDRNLSCAVVDPGIVLSCKCDSSATVVSIKLKCPIEPSDRHSVVLVDHSAQCLSIPSSHVICDEADPSEWLVDLGEWPWWSMNEPVAVAIAYDSYRLGAWWDPAWHRWLLSKWQVEHDDTQRTMELAALIRWLKLPVLMRDANSALGEFVCNSAIPVMKAWLFQDEVTILSSTGEVVLRFADADEGWLVVLRKLLRRWHPTGEQAAIIEKNLRIDSTVTPLESVVFRLGRIDPLLMGRVVAGWLESNGTSNDWRALIGILRNQLARIATDGTIRQTSLTAAVERATGWDSRFTVDGLIEPARRLFRGEHIESWEEVNLDVALNVEAFRRLLADAILDEVLKTVLNHAST